VSVGVEKEQEEPEGRAMDVENVQEAVQLTEAQIEEQRNR
jgi:hypothetical protein